MLPTPFYYNNPTHLKKYFIQSIFPCTVLNLTDLVLKNLNVLCRLHALRVLGILLILIALKFTKIFVIAD